TKDSTGMAIKPYLIEVIGIDLWHAVEFSRYGCAPIPGLTAISRARRIPPLSQGRRRNLGRDRI
ncbi:MAG: hypothetical protein ACKOHL_06875, partial [Actinomycetota bacterium]